MNRRKAAVNEALSGYEKAAHPCCAIGEASAVEVLKALDQRYPTNRVPTWGPWSNVGQDEHRMKC